MKILVPFDFTEVSVNALKYAVKCFAGSEIHILHVDDDSSTFEYSSSSIVYSKKGFQKFVLEKLELETIPDELHLELKYGLIIDQIVDYQRKNNFNYVVMGSRDKYDLLDNLFGTVSLSLIKKLTIPIYVIPRFAKFKLFEKVLVASDHHLENITLLKKLVEWNQDYRAFLKFIHIANDSKPMHTEKEALLRVIYENELDFGFEFESISAKDIADSILAFAYNYQADLLTVFVDRPNFIKSIFHKSVSKQLLAKAHIPLLFFHSKL